MFTRVEIKGETAGDWFEAHVLCYAFAREREEEQAEKRRSFPPHKLRREVNMIWEALQRNAAILNRWVTGQSRVGVDERRVMHVEKDKLTTCADELEIRCYHSGKGMKTTTAAL